MQRFAPYHDNYDIIIGVVLLLGPLASFVILLASSEITGFVELWGTFIENSGPITLVTAFTAFIALYRLRHRRDRIRPAVREDIENGETEGKADFGLRNFGPGPALYLQVLATVECGDEVDSVACSPVHAHPIHLPEGGFASLVQDAESNWLEEMAEKYDTDLTESNRDEEHPPMVNLYYSYVSQTGAREPTYVSTKRDDEDILNDLKNMGADVRHVELSRVLEECRTPS